MKNLLMENTSAVLPGKKASGAFILVKDGKIEAILDKRPGAEFESAIDLTGTTLFPGFIDIHIHGAVGVDTNTATTEDLERMAEFLASQGTTAWLPTFVPDADEVYKKRVEAIDEFMKIQADLPVSQIAGLHYEGVFANEKMCGALRPEFFKKFTTGKELQKLPTLKAPDAVYLTTFAPEVEGGLELVNELCRQNWIPSIGHTRADAETLDRAFAAGARHVTHLFNAMTGVHHREIGVAGWALMNDKISCEVIADGVHVHPKMLALAHKNKTAENLILVSDAVAPTGLGDGEYDLWGERIKVVGGRTQNERGSIAGSVITMLDAVRQMLRLGVTEWEVSQMASLNPARLLGIETTHGSLEVGKRADLVAIDEQGKVRLSLVGGQVCFSDI